eukprot:11179580-Lingulodinium_polyedra.AAC.1
MDHEARHRGAQGRRTPSVVHTDPEARPPPRNAGPGRGTTRRPRPPLPGGISGSDAPLRRLPR